MASIIWPMGSRERSICAEKDADTRGQERRFTPTQLSILLLTPALIALWPASLAAQATESIRGRVEDELRRPIDNAQVELKLEPNVRRVVSNASGAFVFNTVPRGTYELRVRRLGYEPKTVALSIDGVDSPQLVITLTAIPLLLDSIRVLERSGGIRYGATVTDQFDQPIADANVAAEGIDARLRTDSFGRFNVTNAKRGTLMIRVRKLGYRPYLGAMQLRGDRLDTLRLTRLPETLSTIQVHEQSGFGRDTFAYLELHRRIGWQGSFAGVISREELDEHGTINLCVALSRTPTGVRLQIRATECNLSRCILVDGEKPTILALSAFDVHEVEAVEYYPPRSDWSGTLAPRIGTACNLVRSAARSVFVVWLRSDTVDTRPRR